jgi:hypothetical protein
MMRDREEVREGQRKRGRETEEARERTRGREGQRRWERDRGSEGEDKGERGRGSEGERLRRIEQVRWRRGEGGMRCHCPCIRLTALSISISAYVCVQLLSIVCCHSVTVHRLCEL